MRFTLVAPINLSPTDSIPAGETGRIARHSDSHLSLIFDNPLPPALSYWGNTVVLDEYDTEPEIWAAIKQLGWGGRLHLQFGANDNQSRAPAVSKAFVRIAASIMVISSLVTTAAVAQALDSLQVIDLFPW